MTHRRGSAPRTACADQIGLVGWRSLDRHIGLAHRKIELLVGGDQRDADVGIEIDELAQSRREPMHADAGVCTLSSPFGRSRLSVSLARAASSFMNTSCAVWCSSSPCSVRMSPRVAMEQRYAELLLQRRYLPRHRRLRQAEPLTGVREAAGQRRRGRP